MAHQPLLASLPSMGPSLSPSPSLSSYVHQLTTNNGIGDSTNGTDTSCELESSMHWFDVTMGWVLLVGVGVSFIPQIYEMVRIKNTATLSPLTLFIGNFAPQAQAVNALILTFFQRYKCCTTDWTLYQCLVETTGFVQIVAMAIFNFPIFLMYFWYIRDQTQSEVSMARRLWNVLMAFMFIVFVATICFLVFSGYDSTASIWYAKIMGGVCLIGNGLQWAPQLATTFQAKTAGAMSIGFLLLQAPGGAALAYFQIFPQREDITTWLPTVLNVSEMFLLLVLCCYYTILERRAARDALNQRWQSTRDKLLAQVLAHGGDEGALAMVDDLEAEGGTLDVLEASLEAENIKQQQHARTIASAIDLDITESNRSYSRGSSNGYGSRTHSQNSHNNRSTHSNDNGGNDDGNTRASRTGTIQHGASNNSSRTSSRR